MKPVQIPPYSAACGSFNSLWEIRETESERQKTNTALTNKYEKEDYIPPEGHHGRRYSICE